MFISLSLSTYPRCEGWGRGKVAEVLMSSLVLIGEQVEVDPTSSRLVILITMLLQKKTHSARWMSLSFRFVCLRFFVS